MANEVTIRILAKDDASRVFKDVSHEATGFGKVLGNVGQIASGFLFANVISGAGAKLAGFFSSSTKAASDLGESVNAVNVIFGDSAGKILDWGKTASTQAGLSQRAFQQLATPLGAMLKNAGFDMDEVADKTIDLTRRAADMASVFNTDVEDALAAIQAGLRGELDPLEKYGVKLSAATVEQKALAMTGKNTAASLTETEKAAARVALIFEQTNVVAGDFVNTSDQLANKTRIQNARMEELQATIGQKLLPVQMAITEAKLKLVEVIAGKVIPYLEKLYKEHWPAIAKALEDASGWYERHKETIQAVFTFIYEFVKTKIEGMIQSISGVIVIISGVIDLVSNLFHGRWREAWEDLKQIASGALDILVGIIKNTLGSIPEIILGFAGDAWNAAKGLGDSIYNGIKAGIEGIVTWVTDQINALIRAYNSIPVVPKIGEIGGPNPQTGSYPNAPPLDTWDPIGQRWVTAEEMAMRTALRVANTPVPMYQSGISFVPRNMLALLHRGEAVIPASQNTPGAGGVTVNMPNAVIYARDEADAMRSAGDMAWGIGLALRVRGLVA